MKTRILSIIFFSVLVSFGNSFALDITVTSLTKENIQTGINQVAAAGGGTVYLPSGTLNNAGEIYTVCGVAIIGSCTGGPPCSTVMNVRDRTTHKWGPLPTTIFTGAVGFRGNNPWRNPPRAVYDDSDPTKVMRISAIRFNTSSGGLITTRGVKLFRFDHIDFDYVGPCVSGRYVAAIDQEPGLSSAGDAYAAMGVIDHNNHFCGDYMWYLGPRLFGDQCSELGTDNTDATGYPDAIYIEDNYFENFGHPIASMGSVNYVMRHNYVTAKKSTGGWGYGLDIHGPGFHEIWGQNYGGCVAEVYDNTFTQDGLGWTSEHIRFRAGRSILYNNTIENCGYYATFVWETCGASQAIYGDECEESPHNVYTWNNTLNNVSQSSSYKLEGDCGNPDCISGSDITEGSAMPGYTPFTYPHPLVSGNPGPPPNPAPEPPQNLRIDP